MFTHIENEKGKMVDVSRKENTLRTATARTIVILPTEIVSKLKNGDISSPKGPIFNTAIVAASMAVKKTAELIPFCHQLNIEAINTALEIKDTNCLQIECTVKCFGKTGVEMEALTGSSIAALTVYDMCKSFSKKITIRQTELITKTGGKSDYQKDNSEHYS